VGGLIDAHAHLDKYGADLPRALAQIRGLPARTLAVSMDLESFRATQAIAAEEPLILPSFGVHPWEAPRYADNLDVLAGPLAEAVLFGEIGLDHRFIKDEHLYPAQNTVFAHFLDAAERTRRLVNLHTTGAEADVLASLQKRSLPAVIVHWYSGPPHLIDAFLELGAYFTVGVEVLRSKKMRALAARLPADRILTETDNPGGWEWMTKEVGFPELIARVEENAAAARRCPREELSAMVEENFVRVLRAGGVELAGR